MIKKTDHKYDNKEKSILMTSMDAIQGDIKEPSSSTEDGTERLAKS